MEAIATGLAVEAAKAMTKIVVSSSAFEELRSLWCVNDDKFVQMKNKLSGIQAFLNDLGKKPLGEIESDLVNGWIQEVKDVACSAENLINDYNYEKLRRKLKFKMIDHNRLSFKKKSIITMKKCRNYMAPSTNPCMFRIRMIHRVDRILLELDGVHKKATENLKLVKLVNYGLDSAPNTRDKLYHVRKEPPTDTFIGRDQDKENLLQMLRNPTNEAHNDIPIVVIVGLGGLGKTTLARKLYEHDKDHDEGPFNGEKIWICVSEQFDGDKILKEMVGVLTKGETFNSDNTDAIIHKVREKLKGKKLFLVLDDVWNDDEELWDSFKTKLQRIGVPMRGSVILITTRLNKVVEATGAGASGSYKLKGLSNEYAWDLLKKQVSFDSSFDDVAKRILEKCQGVPLAIKAIGCTLKQLKNPSDWHQIETSEVWLIKQKDDKDYIMPSLLLSYNHFKEASIKQCFACCAIYPKDRVMKKGELIALWSAQGLLHHDEDQSNNNSTLTMETIGENYIDVLINHSFLLLEHENEDYQTMYKMHDLVHDLATQVLKKDLLELKSVDKLEGASHLRHLAINLEKYEMAPHDGITLPVNEIKKLRTLIFWNYGLPMWNSLNGARYLCTLIMVNIGLKEVPPIIGQLVHLRYLDLSNNYRLKALPESICNLYQLQTLGLLLCFELKELPRELHRLEKLRHIQATNYMFPSKGLQQLTNLETLPSLELRAEEGWKIDELGSLNQVKGRIDIRGLSHVKNKEEATKACLGKKDKILQLNLDWDEDREESSGLYNDEDVLEGLEPHPNIQSLSVQGYMGVKFPKWIMKMSVKQLPRGHPTHLSGGLTKVVLDGCRKCQQLPSLGQLPNLKFLKLENFLEVKCIGDEFYNSNDTFRECPSVGVGDVIFPSLKTLRIRSFERLTTWVAPSSALAVAFPSLEELKVRSCPNLITTPFVQLKSLKHVVFDTVGGTILDMVKGSNNLINLKLGKIKKMRMLPEELSNCSNLQSLEIDDCENLECIPNGLTSLETLTVGRCPSLSSIPVALSSLRNLSIRNCKSLACIPIDFEDCMSLEDLAIEDCPLIAGPNPDMEKLEGLKLLSLKDAGLLSTSSLRWIPRLHGLTKLYLNGLTEEWDISLISSLTSLTYLELRNCPNFKALTTQQPLIGLESDVPNLSQLKRLEQLILFNAGEMMTSAARSITQLDSLRELGIGGFKDEEEITKFVSQIKSTTTPHSHSHPLSLRVVRLVGWPKVKKMPEQLQHLLPSSTLQELIIHTFDELEQLPDWIGNLSSLKTLLLYSCKKLKYLPSKQAMLHLSQLYISNCPELKERCQKHSNNENENENDNGPPHSESQWPNIEHIPFIMIDMQTIQNLD